MRTRMYGGVRGRGLAAPIYSIKGGDTNDFGEIHALHDGRFHSGDSRDRLAAVPARLFPDGRKRLVA